MKRIILTILDGVGVCDKTKGNAFYNAKTPNIDYLLNTYPHSLLDASGTSVGLPSGQMGNSEVGHMTIGSGRVIYQSLEYINKQIENKTFKDNKVLNETIDHAKKHNSTLHFMGLLSNGGVHSSIYHLFTLLEMCAQKNIEKVSIHVFTDGRDTLPKSSIKYIEMLNNKIKELNTNYKIASISGRFYAMDRDNRYERIKECYDVLTGNSKEDKRSIFEIINDSYNKNVTDEFIKPTLLDKKGTIKSNDSIIVYNFRPDRLREILTSLTDKTFNEFQTKPLDNLKVASMMHVNNNLNIPYAFSLEEINNPLGVYIDKMGISQLRIAETEKYAHVTYFFDGGKEIKLNNAKRILVPSPKVKTYDMKPSMSAYEINEALYQELKNKKYDLIVLNYANGDMVGHTGVYDKAIEAVETVDKALGELYQNLKNDYTFLITADHGNCEAMINEDGSINTAHTTNKVFFIVTEDDIKLNNGSLKDISPTILDLMNIRKEKEMTGKSLIIDKEKMFKKNIKKTLKAFNIDNKIEVYDNFNSIIYKVCNIEYEKIRKIKYEIAVSIGIKEKDLVIKKIDNDIDIIKNKESKEIITYDKLDELYKYDENNIKIPLGIDEYNTLTTFDLKKDKNLFITGTTGIGKSNLISYIILNELKYYSDKKIVVLDMQKVNYTLFSPYIKIMKEKSEMAEFISNLYSSKIEEEIIVIIDEIYDLFDYKHSLSSKINYLINNKPNIHFILTNDTIMDREVYSIFSNKNAIKISFNLTTTLEYNLFLGKKIDPSLGYDMIYKKNNQYKRLSTCKITDELIIKNLEEKKN